MAVFKKCSQVPNAVIHCCLLRQSGNKAKTVGFNKGACIVTNAAATRGGKAIGVFYNAFAIEFNRPKTLVYQQVAALIEQCHTGGAAFSQCSGVGRIGLFAGYDNCYRII